MNGEDILLNFVFANATEGEPPLIVQHTQKLAHVKRAEVTVTPRVMRHSKVTLYFIILMKLIPLLVIFMKVTPPLTHSELRVSVQAWHPLRWS